AGGRAYDAAPPGPRRSARRIGRVDRLGPTGDGRSTLFDPTVWEPNDHQAREAREDAGLDHTGVAADRLGRRGRVVDRLSGRKVEDFVFVVRDERSAVGAYP